MTNDLRKLSKDLKAFAKRCKDFKYTEQMLFVFLLCGILGFSDVTPTDKAIQTKRQEISTSIGDMRQEFKKVKSENDKLVKNYNLELIQLMEQGDQAVKSPWSNWQYGMNFFYNDWQGKYKGRGDKTENIKYKRDASSKFGTFDGGKYGTTALNNKVIEPISAVPVDAAVKPKDIHKTALNINLPKIGAPTTPNISILAEEPKGIETVTVIAPTVSVPGISPNASPFLDFSFTHKNLTSSYVSTSGNSWTSNASGSTPSNRSTIWNGFKPGTGGGYVNGYGYSGADSSLSPTIASPRPDYTVYVNHSANATDSDAFVIENMDLYLAGNVGGAGQVAGNHDGVIGLHTVRNGTIRDVTANLYGKADFLSIETWHSGKIALNNVKVNITGDDNTIFYIYPATYEASNGYRSDLNAYHQRGGFTGAVNADIKSNKNIVYNVLGASGSFGIKSEGIYKLEGSENIVYSNTGYSPDFQKIAGSSSHGAIRNESYSPDMTPFINLSKPVESYGDGNILMFFANQTSEKSTNSGGRISVWDQGGSDKEDLWDKSAIGIYQGEVGVNGIIGEYAGMNKASTQTANGQKTGNYSNYVEKNVGILGWSGQRKDIKPAEDLGAETSVTNNANYNAGDPIHSLYVNEANISFGKYALSGIMFASQNGTVMDVAKGSNTNNAGSDGVAVSSASITDFGQLTNLATAGKVVSSETDANNEAATGTILAYSQGVFGDKMNRMSSGTSTSTNTLLQGKSSEINIGTNVEMSGRSHTVGNDKYYPIAYLAKDAGKITVDGTTKAHGYGSLVAYAENLGSVTTTGDVTAIDDWADNTDSATKKMLYTNIGAYAYTNGGSYKNQWSGAGQQDARDNAGSKLENTEITMNGKLTINGLGALAKGSKAIVNLKGTGNVIKTGTSGALVAQDGGTVNFYGGTITNENIQSITGATDNTHEKVTPFYADNNSSKISFEGATTLNISDGLLVNGKKSDYESTKLSAATPTTARYYGMGNVDVNITGNGVNLGIFDGLSTANGTAVTWDGTSATYLNSLKALPQFKSLTVGTDPSGNEYTYKSTLINGDLTIATNVNLSDPTDKFNNISMANENVTINAGKNVTSTNGKGLSMGSVAGNVTKNSTTAYHNEGTVNVTGGTSSAAINVSFGTIENKSGGTVSVDDGAGIYGTNGSKLVNDTGATINVTTKGAGIAAYSIDPSATTMPTYGVNNSAYNSTTGIKEIEIINKGALNVAGDNAVGIFADNNTNTESVATPRQSVTIDNESQIVVGKDGIGIALKNSGNVSTGAGTITTKATGTGSDITAGVNGKGIYAKDSDINLTNGDYVIETKEGGIGIFASGSTNVTGTLEYKYNGSTTGTGMGIVYDQIGAATHTNKANVKLTNATNTTGGMVGVYTTAPSGTFINNGDITGSSTALEFGIVSDGADVVNKKTITLGNAASQANANVGIYAKANNTITNDTTGTINVGDNAIGIYGYSVNNNKDIKAGDNGVAIYTQGSGTVNLNSGSTITVGKNQAVGVYAVGSGQNIYANTGSSMTIGNNSFGIVNVGSGNTVTSQTTNPVTLGTDAVYIYQNDNTGHVFNYTPLTSAGDRNYGLYGNGTIENHGDINFSTGNGNVGVYSTGGTATNFATIKVGASNTSAKEYGVGMATGYYDDTPGSPTRGQTFNQGTVINRGTIEVSQPNTMGMYAVGAGSKAVNYGNIDLSGSSTIGMYIDRGATGENWGNIRTTASGLTSVKGIYVANGSYVKNYGTIAISATDLKSAGVWTDTQSVENVDDTATGVNPTTGTAQTGTSTPRMKVVTADDMKEMGGITIKVPPRMTPPTVTDAQGNVIPIFKVDTDVPTPAPTTAIVTSPSGITSINLATSNFLNFPSASEASSLGMYVDTSGVNYTNPIQGINNLTGLTDINLFFGTEASRYTTARAIEVGDNILKPYNDALSGVVTAGTTLNVTSASLTWMAQPTKNAATGLLDKVYLVKIPYTLFAKKGDTQTYNFLASLEQKYGQEGVGTREKAIFDKINSLNGGEGHILAQAIDEMKGHQYSNIQQRTKETGDILSQEFNYLKDEWRNPTKDNNKIKMFGHRGEYNTDTAGVVDYTDNAYGVAYVHENETVKLGRKSGWYAGAVTNRFEFKDLGKSKETQTMIKAGLFKTVSPYNDHNGSLTWTIAGEAFAGINNMTRRYWIVDDTFEAKSDYTTYGVALKNEIGKDFRTSERTSIRPYGALNLEYGRYSNIKEDGPMALEVKGNDYFSVQPELGVAFNYSQPVGVKSHFKASLTAAYTNELGEVNDVRNKARLKGTTADYYELRGDKEDRKGNGKFDLNIGFDNTRFGVTVNAGYDTKGENIRGGIGFRAIY